MWCPKKMSYETSGDSVGHILQGIDLRFERGLGCYIKRPFLSHPDLKCDQYVIYDQFILKNTMF